MSNEPDPPTNEADAVGAESFEAWLAQAAESKGVSQQELMDQMLSSYWILDELTGLVDGADSERATGVPEPDSPERENDGPDAGRDEAKTEPTEPAESDDPDDLGADREAVAEMVESLSPAYLEEIEDNVRTLQSAVRKLEQQGEADRSAPELSANAAGSVDGSLIAIISYMLRQFEEVESELMKLDRIEEIEADLEKLERVEEIEAELRKLDRIDEIEDELAALRERQSSDTERLSDNLQLALDRVGQLEAERDEFVRDDDVDAAITAIDDDIETVKEEQAALEDRIEREFDSIEELFGDLFGSIEEIDDRVAEVAESYREDVPPLAERETERKRLEDLKTEALLEEERNASCGNCNQAIDIGLLESPRCPNCNGRFEGLTDSGWNPFKPPILEAEPPREY
jgi:hypothetical protein